MADQYLQNSYSSEGLTHSIPSVGADSVLEQHHPGDSVLPSLRRRRAIAPPSLNLEAKTFDQTATSFALLTDSSTRFQLPKISSAGLTEQIRAETEESLLESEFDTESCSEAARDSGALLSDLLDRLEEAAARSPEPRSQASVAFAAERYAQSDFNTDPAAEDKRLDFLQALQPWPGSTEENPVSGVETTGGFTLSQSYRVLLERFPSNITDESGSKKQDTRESQVGKDSRSDPKNENTSPVTPQPKRRKKKDLTPTLSPFLFGPFPTPTAHLFVIAKFILALSTDFTHATASIEPEKEIYQTIKTSSL
ncbi:hypothetical protein PDE_08637 [Penicillium oxalicum 114-2]|uniref:Uncharacterized protein n=1 Tax=Penicillium oxalicum (strain 114-2 / CGMCC 5302) TaxID=933388 RepID=S7ZSI5_PENO1|nr:hypothetical protein PDE_08637 [Penicillium oxalicum 114-2]